MSATSTSQLKKSYILMITGSFVTPDQYAFTTSLLVENGYKVDCMSPSSVWDPIATPVAPTPAPTMADDAAVIASHVQKLLDSGVEDIALVMHSYSGLPGTEAAKGLGKVAREAKGLKGGIVKLVYLTALVGKAGQSSNDVFQETAKAVPTVKQAQEASSKQPPTMVLEGEYLVQQNIQHLVSTCVSDMDPQEGSKWMEKMCRHSAASFAGRLTHETYQDIPAAYIVCTEDKLILPAMQEFMIQTMRDSGANVEVWEIEGAGHAPILSKPRETSLVIRKVLGENIK